MSHSELFDALGFWIKQGCPRQVRCTTRPLGRVAKALVRANGRIKPIQMPGAPSLQHIDPPHVTALQSAHYQA